MPDDRSINKEIYEAELHVEARPRYGKSSVSYSRIREKEKICMPRIGRNHGIATLLGNHQKYRDHKSISKKGAER